MGREGLMDDAGYRFDERDCPETVDGLNICEICMLNGTCEIKRGIEEDALTEDVRKQTIDEFVAEIEKRTVNMFQQKYIDERVILDIAKQMKGEAE